MRNISFSGVNKKNKKPVKYPDVPSAIKPIPHGPGILIPNVPQNLTLHEVCDDEARTVDDSETFIPPSSNFNEPQPLTQAKLNDLTRDLGLSKKSAQLLGSWSSIYFHQKQPTIGTDIGKTVLDSSLPFMQ